MGFFPGSISEGFFENSMIERWGRGDRRERETASEVN
jgi:hypothetical protein